MSTRPEVTPEVLEQTALTVQGQLPKWLSGVHYRMGAGVHEIFLADGKILHASHPYDALAHTHRFSFSGSNNQIFYLSRQTSKGRARAISAGEQDFAKFGEDPSRNTFKRFVTFLKTVAMPDAEESTNWTRDPSDCNVGMAVTGQLPLIGNLEHEFGHEAYIVATTDDNMLQILDPKTLEPKKVIKYEHIDNELVGQLSCAHPQYDSDTQEFFNYLITPSTSTTSFTMFSLSFVTLNSKAVLYPPLTRHLGDPSYSIQASYTHSFVLTPRYIIFPTYPVNHNPLKKLWTHSRMASLEWDEASPTLFHLIDRSTRLHVATYEAETCFALHTVNAFDDSTSDSIVLDIAAYTSYPALLSAQIRSSTTPGLRSPQQINPSAQLRRYQLRDVSLVRAAQAQRRNDDLLPYRIPKAYYEVITNDFELPAINPAYARQPYRYAYGISRLHDRSTPHPLCALIKVDMIEKSVLTWAEPTASCAEPIFVSAPEPKSEDDGVIITVVSEVTAEKSWIVVLEAKELKEIARAEVGSFAIAGGCGCFFTKQ